MHRIALKPSRLAALCALPLVFCAAGLPPEIDSLMPPPEVQPRVISGKDIPDEEKVSSLRLRDRPPGARDIIVEARLDDRLANRLDELDGATGKADGKLALTDYVMVENGRELVDFVRRHGYRSFHGPVEIRKWPQGRVQVVVRVTGKDGRTVDAVLESDGSVQGAG